MGKKKDDQLTSDAILKQSQAAYKQWAPQWREHATFHSKYAMKSWQDFFAIGIGKACVLAANGWSLELEMDVLREHQKNVDIICCDKSLGHLLRNGIRPTYCLVADANVNYEKYLQPWETELGDTILFMNVCGNPKWTEARELEGFVLLRQHGHSAQRAGVREALRLRERDARRHQRFERHDGSFNPERQ
jgi:hypothetical protein